MAAAAIGLIIGPIIVLFIYDITSYTLTFVIFGSILLLGTILLAFTLPQRVNSIEDYSLRQSSASKQLKPTRVEQVSYSMFLTNARSLYTLLACLLIQVLLCFLDSILA